MCPESPLGKSATWTSEFDAEITGKRSAFSMCSTNPVWVDFHNSIAWMMGMGTACPPRFKLVYIGIRAWKRSNQSAGPPCKCMLGENPQRLFIYVCFHWRWSKGAYCGKLGRCADVTDKPEQALWALCKQSVLCDAHLLPTANWPQTQLTLPCLLSSPGGISLKHSSGAHIPQKGQKNEKPFILSLPEGCNGACGIFYSACVCWAVLFPDKWKRT